MEEDLRTVMEKLFGKGTYIQHYSPLTFAYIGDAVYEMIIRTMVVRPANRPPRFLHRYTVKYVSAKAQARIVEGLMDRLTEEERAIYRRGRNSKPHTTAKNASLTEYLRATGFETLIGYLYLSDKMDRILELVQAGVELIDGRFREETELE